MGVDVDEDALALAQENCKELEVRFMLASSLCLGLTDCSAVFGTFVISLGAFRLLHSFS